jgi:hypothetical protein
MIREIIVYRVWEIKAYHWIELVELYLGQEYELWNMLLGESWQLLLEPCARIPMEKYGILEFLGS